jgi:hypothetical protein
MLIEISDEIFLSLSKEAYFLNVNLKDYIDSKLTQPKTKIVFEDLSKPENHGKKWSKKEIEYILFLKNIDKNVIFEAAKYLKRKHTAILSKLVDLGVLYYNKNLNVYETEKGLRIKL